MKNVPSRATAEGMPDRMADAAKAYREGLARQAAEMAWPDLSEEYKDSYYGLHLAPLRATIEEETPVPTTLPARSRLFGSSPKTAIGFRRITPAS